MVHILFGYHYAGIFDTTINIIPINESYIRVLEDQTRDHLKTNKNFAVSGDDISNLIAIIIRLSWSGCCLADLDSQSSVK